MDHRSAEPIDAWGDLGARYRHDSHAQFVLFVEQLAVARELLFAGEISKHRMALVAVDNLAELVLYRHKRRLSEAAEESWRDVEPRLDSKDEQRFRGSFTVRVELGRKGAGSGILQFAYAPVLDVLDAGIFRVGHRYRNRAYHADHHNAAALDCREVLDPAERGVILVLGLVCPVKDAYDAVRGIDPTILDDLQQPAGSARLAAGPFQLLARPGVRHDRGQPVRERLVVDRLGAVGDAVMPQRERTDCVLTRAFSVLRTGSAIKLRDAWRAARA